MLDTRLNPSWWSLRLAFGAVPIVAGLDKFANVLTDWQQYLSPWAERLLPVSGTTLMQLVGLIEIAAGLLVLSKFTRIGAYVVSAWLLVIALNLLTMGRFLDVAVRDIVLAISAFTLARMTEVREAGETSTQRSADGRKMEPARVGL